jgi:ribosome-associated heat shock protein Hsp15
VEVRLDKWLQVARAFKTRSAATRACTLGRVEVNSQRAKPHRSLAIGDRVEIERRNWTQIWIVRELADRPLPKAEAPRLYEDIGPGPRATPPPPPTGPARGRRGPADQEGAAGDGAVSWIGAYRHQGAL